MGQANIKLSKKEKKNIEKILESNPEISFDERETTFLWEEFHRILPKGYAVKEDLPNIFGYLRDFPQLSENLFRVFDRSGDGKISFDEYLKYLSIITRGTLGDKLELTFILFDLDEDKTVDQEEARTVVTLVGDLLLKYNTGLLSSEELNSSITSLNALVFKGETVLPIKVFKERALSCNVILNCFCVFEFLFTESVALMESRMGSQKVFGRDLKSLLKAESRSIPYLVESTIKFLELNYEEGIFRLAGPVKEVLDMKAEINQGKRINFNEPLANPHSVAALLKNFFGELPEPLFTHLLQDKFISSLNFETEKKQDFIIETLHSLPHENYNLLKYLISFLSKLSKHEQKTLMGASNLSKVFAPILMNCEASNKDMQLALELSRKGAELVEYLILNYSTIFEKESNSESHLTERNEVKKIEISLQTARELNIAKDREIADLKKKIEELNEEVSELKLKLVMPPSVLTNSLPLTSVTTEIESPKDSPKGIKNQVNSSSAGKQLRRYTSVKGVGASEVPKEKNRRESDAASTKSKLESKPAEVVISSTSSPSSLSPPTRPTRSSSQLSLRQHFQVFRGEDPHLPPKSSTKDLSEMKRDKKEKKKKTETQIKITTS